MKGADLRGVNLSGVDLNGAKWEDLVGIDCASSLNVTPVFREISRGQKCYIIGQMLNVGTHVISVHFGDDGDDDQFFGIGMGDGPDFEVDVSQSFDYNILSQVPISVYIKHDEALNIRYANKHEQLSTERFEIKGSTVSVLVDADNATILFWTDKRDVHTVQLPESISDAIKKKEMAMYPMVGVYDNTARVVGYY